MENENQDINIENPEDAGKKKKKKVWRTVLLSVGSFLLVLVLGFVGIFWYFFGGLQTEELDTENLGIDSSYHSSIKQEKKITNIARFGIDSRAGGNSNQGLSDATIILSINHQTNKIKLISVMRDSYVQINGRGDKLTHAYSYGGAETAIKTLNENFNLDITEYVTVNFDQMSNVINSIGGVRIDVTEAERNQINGLMFEIRKGNTNYLTVSGKQILLTGDQAVAYARIRKLDSDQARTGRQREVLMAVFDKVMTMNVLEYPALAKSIIPMVTTSFSYDDVFDFLPVLTSGQAQIEQTMIPCDKDNPRDAMINGVYYMQYDLDLATDHIHNFIYKDIHPDAEPEEESTQSVSSSASASASQSQRD